MLFQYHWFGSNLERNCRTVLIQGYSSSCQAIVGSAPNSRWISSSIHNNLDFLPFSIFHSSWWISNQMLAGKPSLRRTFSLLISNNRKVGYKIKSLVATILTWESLGQVSNPWLNGPISAVQCSKAQNWSDGIVMRLVYELPQFQLCLCL